MSYFHRQAEVRPAQVFVKVTAVNYTIKACTNFSHGLSLHCPEEGLLRLAGMKKLGGCWFMAMALLQWHIVVAALRHTLHIHQQGQPSIKFTSTNCQEDKEQCRGQVLHTKYSAFLIRVAGVVRRKTYAHVKWPLQSALCIYEWFVFLNKFLRKQNADSNPGSMTFIYCTEVIT